MNTDIILEVKNITKSFGGIQAVQDLSFDVRANSVQAIIGPNGAGKTTVFNMITGFYAPDSGEIRFEGARIDNVPPDEVTKRGIARTFQNLEIFPSLSVLENVMLGCHIRMKTTFIGASLRLPSMKKREMDIREKALEILNFVGLKKVADESSDELPFGWQRLLEIARALATNPSLILLDEPASGLNPAETELVGDLILQLRERGLTVLMVEHDMSLTMDISDNIVVMDYGRKIACGSPRDVQKNPAVIAAYLGEEIDA